MRKGKLYSKFEANEFVEDKVLTKDSEVFNDDLYVASIEKYEAGEMSLESLLNLGVEYDQYISHLNSQFFDSLLSDDVLNSSNIFEAFEILKQHNVLNETFCLYFYKCFSDSELSQKLKISDFHYKFIKDSFDEMLSVPLQHISPSVLACMKEQPDSVYLLFEKNFMNASQFCAQLNACYDLYNINKFFESIEFEKLLDLDEALYNEMRSMLFSHREVENWSKLSTSLVWHIFQTLPNILNSYIDDQIIDLDKETLIDLCFRSESKKQDINSLFNSQIVLKTLLYNAYLEPTVIQHYSNYLQNSSFNRDSRFSLKHQKSPTILLDILFEHYQTVDEIDQQLLNLIKAYKICMTHDFSKNQLTQVIEAIRDSGQKQERFELLDQSYALSSFKEFDELLVFLKKDEKRNLMNI